MLIAMIILMWMLFFMIMMFHVIMGAIANSCVGELKEVLKVERGFKVKNVDVEGVEKLAKVVETLGNLKLSIGVGLSRFGPSIQNPQKMDLKLYLVILSMPF